MAEDATLPAAGDIRLFTVDEANALLPSLIPILTALRRQKRDLDQAQRQLAKLTPAMQGNGQAGTAAELEQRIVSLAHTLTENVKRIVSQGVALKDLDQGLIDFPARRGDRIVLLCWRLGEDQLAYWHEVDTGFAGRQPL